MRKGLGPLQTKAFEIIKQEKEIRIVEIGKRLGYYPKQMNNVHYSMYGLWYKKLISIRGKTNKVAVFIQDYVEPPPKIKPPRKIIKIEEVERIIDSMKEQKDYIVGWNTSLEKVKEMLK